MLRSCYSFQLFGCFFNQLILSVVQKQPYAWAYVANGEAKFEELSVIFAQPVAEIIVLSSDDEDMKPPNNESRKAFVLVDDDMPEMDRNLANGEHAMGFQDLADDMQGLGVEPYAIVPYVEPLALQSIPPLDMMDISSTSTQSSLFNWWDYLEKTSDDEGSTATDSSTARSFTFATWTNKRGFREHGSHYKTRMSPAKHVHLSSTASNSPLAKTPPK